MHFLIKSFSLLPAHTHDCNSIVQRGNVVTLQRTAQVGSLKTPVFDAKLLRGYAGFEVFPSEVGVKVALIDSSDQLWSFQNNGWQLGGINTPEEIRAGLPSWTEPVRFLIRLERLENGESPRINRVGLGYRVAGNILAYVVEYALVKLFSTPIYLSRWVDSDTDPIVGLNRDRIISVNHQKFQGRYQAEVNYQSSVTVIPGNQVYQVDEVPCILLKFLDTGNHRRMNEFESIRLNPTQSELVSHAYAYDQSIEVTIIAQKLPDARDIADQFFAMIDSQGFVSCPAYGFDAALLIDGVIRVDNADQSAMEGQLSSVTFNLLILNLPGGDRAETIGILQDIDLIRAIPDSNH